MSTNPIKRLSSDTFICPRCGSIQFYMEKDLVDSQYRAVCIACGKKTLKEKKVKNRLSPVSPLNQEPKVLQGLFEAKCIIKEMLYFIRSYEKTDPDYDVAKARIEEKVRQFLKNN